MGKRGSLRACRRENYSNQGANSIGHLTHLADQAGSADYSYDILGRLSSETRTTAGVSKTVSYDYNLDGSLMALHYPSGAVVTYTPDSAGRTISAVDTTNAASPINYVTGATYGPDNALTGFISGNSTGFAGIANKFSYTPRLQPCRMMAGTGTLPASCADTTTAPAGLLDLTYDFHYGSGNNGNVWGITNQKDTTRNQTFTYDVLNRLLSARNAGTDCNVKPINPNQTKFWGNSYSYDAWGNLLNKSSLANTCAGEGLSVTVVGNNRISTAGYAYDAAGNMTKDGLGHTYTYDQENRITGAAGYTYTYDADGNRVKKANGTDAASGTLYWYMTPGIVAESDLVGTLKSEYVFFGGERVARRDLVAPAGVSYYFSDYLKTASVITDATGNIKAESDYYPWGGELQFVNADSNHYKFTGKERDSETQLDYFGARYYSNGLGRWVTPDRPFADQHHNDPQSWNLYMYGRNNPSSLIDDNGEAVVEHVKNVTYQVHGNTAEAALQNAPRVSGLRDGDGTQSSGNTHVEVSSTVKTVTVETANGDNGPDTAATMTVDTADVNLNIAVTLPEWTERGWASPAEQKKWDDAVTQLKAHEKGHVSIAEKSAQKLDKALPGTSGSATGNNKQEAVQKAGKKMQKNVSDKAQTQAKKDKQEQDAYDRRTQHTGTEKKK